MVKRYKRKYADKRRRNKFAGGHTSHYAKTAFQGGKNGTYHERGSRLMAWHHSPFPFQMLTQFTFCDNQVISVVGGVPTAHRYLANSLYDPDFTTGIGGGQPRFLDTLLGANNTSAPYSAYVVYRAKIIVQFMPTAGADSLGMRCMLGIGAYPSATTAPSTLAEMRGRSDFKTKLCGYWSGGHDIITLKRYIDMKTVLNARSLDDRTGCQGTYSTSPSNTAVFDVIAVPVDELATYAFRIIVKVVYYAKLYNRNDVADS